MLRTGWWAAAVTLFGVFAACGEQGPTAPAAPAVIAGVVLDAEGLPLGSVEVDTEPLAGSALTGEDGSYRLELSAGTYAVHARRTGYRPATQQDVTVAMGGSALVDFTLLREDVAGELRGSVRVAGTSEPLPGATVRTEPASVEATTGSDGRYVLAAIPPGTWSVIAEAEGYASSHQAGVELAAGDARVIDFELAAEAVFASTCERCHLTPELLLADLTADPPPEGPAPESEGEG